MKMPKQITSVVHPKSQGKPPVLLRTFGDVQIWQDAAAPVARVWLNRPQRRNALAPNFMQQITDAFEYLQTCFGITVVILCGRGKSFCAGADLKAASNFNQVQISQRERRYNSQTGRRMIQAITNLEAVTIARVHGHAIGGGFGLMIACDLRVVTEASQLFLPEVDIHLPLTWGLTAMLANEIGMAKAKELIMLCDDLPVSLALSLGVINLATPSDDIVALDAAIDGYAYRLAAKDPGALHMAKTQFRSLQHSVVTGDTTEHDGDLLLMQGLMPSTNAKL